LLIRILDRLKLEWRRGDRQFLLGCRPSTTPNLSGPPTSVTSSPQGALVAFGDPLRGSIKSERGQRSVALETAVASSDLFLEEMVVDLDPFPAMRHITLTWTPETGPQRRDIETELAHELAAVRTIGNPVGYWLYSIAAILFSAIFFIVLFL